MEPYGVGDFLEMEIDVLCDRLQKTKDKDKIEHIKSLIGDLERRLGRGPDESAQAIKQRLLDDYAKRPVTRFVTVDCLAGKDGDRITIGETDVLMAGDVGIRILIKPDTDKDAASRALKKAAEEISTMEGKTIGDYADHPF